MAIVEKVNSWPTSMFMSGSSASFTVAEVSSTVLTLSIS